MKAAYIEKFAPSGNIVLGDLPKPKPDLKQILIRVHYAGVNPVDAKIAEGKLKTRMPYEFPLILGWDVSGTVEEVGEGVQDFSKGDRVYAYCRKPTLQHGCFAEYVAVDASSAALIPNRLSFKEAAVIPLSGLTAWQALFEKAHLKPKETILIHGGAGGVGGYAIQWAKYAKAHPLATGTSRKQKYMKSLGADECIDYEACCFVDWIRKSYPEGIDVVLDTIGKEVYARSFEVLKKGGRIVSLLEEPSLELSKKFGVKAEYLFVEPSGEMLQKIAELYTQNQVQIPIIEEMPLSRVSEAIKKIREGKTKGKVVLKIS